MKYTIQRAALALFLTVTPATYAKKKPAAQPAGPVVFADEIVSTPMGDFAFTHLTLSPDPAYPALNGYKLNGVATNLTGHAVVNPAFEASVTDISGKVQSGFIDFSKISAGKAVPVSSLGVDGISIISVLNPIAPSSQLKIKYLGGGKLDVEYRFRVTKPTISDGMELEDDNIRAVFAVTQTAVQFSILNKTAGPIKIDWNQVSFIDPDSNSYPVTHEGVKYADAAAAKPPSVVPPSAKFSDAVVPANNVSFSSGSWSTRDLLTRSPLAPAMKGRTISIFMPLEINGAQKNYLFSFEITDVLLK